MSFISSEYQAKHIFIGVFAALVGWALIEPFAEEKKATEQVAAAISQM